ncbi:MAG: hypothetical protein AABY22_34255 [Nanoarchaeota archaeon]
MFNLKKILIFILAAIVFIAFLFFIHKSWAWDNGDYDNQTTICHCETSDGDDPFQCQTLNVGLPAAESHLEEHENDYEGACEEDLSPTPTPEEITPTPTLETEPTITSSPTVTPIVVQRSENGGGSGDNRSDGLGCSVKDCSGNKVEPPITLVPCSANNCGWK